MRSPSLSFLILFLAGVATVAPTQSQCDAQFQPGDPLGAPRGDGFATQLFDPDGSGPLPAELVIGGLLDDGGARSVFAFDGTRWRTLGSPPSGLCNALGVFNGELIAAISILSTTTRTDVVAWNGTSWRLLGTTPGEVLCMTAFNGRLVVGGIFTSFSALPAANAVQWDGASWSALGSGITGAVQATYVSALAVYAGVLWVGGSFTHAGGTPANNLATWNGSLWAAAGNVNGVVFAMAVRQSTTVATSFLFLGGGFTQVGTLAASRVARFNQQNGWVALGAIPLTDCRSLAVRSTGSLSFELVAGMPPHVWNGTTWTGLGTGFTQGQALAVFGGRYVAVGRSPATVRVLDATNSWVGLGGPGIDGLVQAIAATASDVVIGGRFSVVSGVTMNGVARGTVGAWQALGSGVLGGDVQAVAVMPDGSVIAGGSFTSAGGVPASRIARFNGSTWSPLGTGLGSTTTDAVRALAVLPDGSLVAGGVFERAGSVVVNNVARWDGTAWSAMGAGLGSALLGQTVRVLAARPDGEVVAAGTFSTSGPTQLFSIARWDGSSWLPMPAVPNATVNSLATLANGDVLVGGFFTAIGTLPTVYLARWNGSTFTAVPGLTHVPFGYAASALVPMSDGGALVSGEVTSPGNPRLLRYDGQTSTALPDPGVTFSNGLRTGNGDVFFVGDFVRPGNVLSAYVTRYVSPCPVFADRYGHGCTGSTGQNDLRVVQMPVLGSVFRARATGMPVIGFALAVTGFAPTSIPLQSLLPQGGAACNLLASADSVETVPFSGGSALSSLPVPALPQLAGMVLHHQFVALELRGLAILTVTSTNGLRLVLGAF